MRNSTFLRRWLPVFGLAIAGLLTNLAGNTARADADDVLVRVDGRPITQKDLDFRLLSHRVADDQRESVRRRFLDRLIDERLMGRYLEERNAKATPEQSTAEVERIHELLRRRGENPEQVFEKIGYTDDMVRKELALPLAWRNFARATITPERLRKYFAKHRREFDGTEVRAAQIFIKATTEEERATAMKKLAAIRSRILDSALTFPEAARRHSESPTGSRGGDLGFFPYRGKMPEEFTRHAFEVAEGEVGTPFATTFGMHLVTVTDIRPGQLSLEDVRRDVFSAFADELWKQTIERLRSDAKIEWVEPVESPE